MDSTGRLIALRAAWPILLDPHPTGREVCGVLRTIIRRETPDVVQGDTSAGLTNEAMVSLATADRLLLAARPDPQEMQGAPATLSVARRPSRPRIGLLGNHLGGSSTGATRIALKDACWIPVPAMLAAVLRLRPDTLEHPAPPDHGLERSIRVLGAHILTDDSHTATDTRRAP